MRTQDSSPAAPARRRLLFGDGQRPVFMRASGRKAKAATHTVPAQPPAGVRWLSKACHGFTQADLATFNALGDNDNARWQAWTNQQLQPANMDDGACDARLAAANYTTLSKSLAQLWADHHSVTDNYTLRMQPLAETEAAMVLRATYSKRQLFERMVGFWHDHFSVYGADYDIGPIFPSYDRDVIRPNALGNFRQMLGAVARSTAMQYYLDNYNSIGANYNENYAREVMELHTLGVANYYGPSDPFNVPCLMATEIHCPGSAPAGYVDNDVYEAARSLTGWTIKNGNWRYPDDNDGGFIYRADWHDHANKVFLGLYIPANQAAMVDGNTVFDRIAAHPGTARHIAGKLCRRFIGDQPPQDIIDAATATFSAAADAPDQIAQVVRVILASDAFKSHWGTGMKRPLEAAIGALRALAADYSPDPSDTTSDWTTTDQFFSLLQQAGHRPFRWGPPNGYPDDITAWSSTGALAMTLKLMAQIPEWHRSTAASPFLTDILAQTKAQIAAPNRNATAIIDYWCDRILGYRPTGTHAIATAFLQQNATANAALDLDTDSWNAGDLKAHYTQQRLRTAVGMLLMNPDYLRR